MKRIITVLILLVTFTQCNKKSSKTYTVTKRTDSDSLYLQSIANRVLNFIYPSDTNFVFKAENFLFSKESRWDTSFVLVMKKESLKVTGAYYQIPPANDASSVVDKRLFFVDGFVFEEDTLVWNKIIMDSKNLMDLPYDFKNDGCADCSSFILANDHRIVSSTNKTKAKFQAFANSIVRDLIIPKYRIKKQLIK